MELFPKKLGVALLSCQGQLRGIQKDGTNPHYKSRYATLENVTDTIRPVLQANGILFMQCPGNVDENGMYLGTSFIHAESGETWTSTIQVPLAKKDPQGIGSAITYACRYSLMAMLGLPPIDDDGESAVELKPQPKKESIEPYKALETESRAQKSEADLKKWMSDPLVKERIAKLPKDWQDTLRIDCQDSLIALREMTQ